MSTKKHYVCRYYVQLFDFYKKVVRLYCGSQSAIFLEKNPPYHAKTNHIDVQYHFVRDMVEDKKVLLEMFDTLKNAADSLTKSIGIDMFSLFMGIDAMNL